MTETDPRYWQWWADKLAGLDVPASEGTPYAGFYRWVQKSKYGGKKYAIPVAYWPGENGELHCRIGFRDVTPDRGEDIWVNVCNHPVEESWYRDVADYEKPEWCDGMGTTPPIGDNEPPADDLEAIQDKIEKAAKEANDYLTGPAITEQVEADKIATLADKMSDLWKLADEARKAERKPHDEALKAIQVKWSPLLLAAEAYKNLKFKLLTPWLKKLDEAKKLEAEAAAAAGEPEAAPKRASRPRAGTVGRAMTLKSFKTANITDYEACLAFFKNSDDIRATVQDLANKAVRAGVTVPGAEMVDEQRAV